MEGAWRYIQAQGQGQLHFVQKPKYLQIGMVWSRRIRHSVASGIGKELPGPFALGQAQRRVAGGTLP